VVDVDQLRAHYDQLDDQELQRIAQTELVPEARAALDAEMSARGLLWKSDADAPAAPRVARANPYAPPEATVSDPHAWAVLSVPGLIRLFQSMVVASALIGVFLFTWPYLPIPMDEDVWNFRWQSGAGAAWGAAAYFIHLVLQVCWILSAFGLCFFKWWARPLFAGTYLLSAVSILLGGFVIWFPWEAFLITVATLLDGAVMALAFLPPLSAYFERDRA
jgi:hypothetical protein